MKKQKYFLLYLIVVLTILLIVTVFGYFNYTNSSFTGLSKDKVYTIGRRVKYANLNWYVLKNETNHVTLILAKNATLGKYGNDVSFKNSFASEFLNNEWIFKDEIKSLKDEISHGALVKDKETNTFLRLVRYDEIKDTLIKNDSNTPYWTMSNEENEMIYVLKNGYTEYTNYKEEDSNNGKCYKGKNISSINELSKYNKTLILVSSKTLSNPKEESVITSINTEKVTDECFENYKIENGDFFQNGTKTTYISSWDLEDKKENIGIRPVITVKKK